MIVFVLCHDLFFSHMPWVYTPAKYCMHVRLGCTVLFNSSTSLLFWVLWVLCHCCYFLFLRCHGGTRLTHFAYKTAWFGACEMLQPSMSLFLWVLYHFCCSLRCHGFTHLTSLAYETAWFGACERRQPSMSLFLWLLCLFCCSLRRHGCAHLTNQCVSDWLGVGFVNVFHRESAVALLLC